MARGLIDGVDRAQEENQDNHVPELDALEIDQRPENKCLKHRENLRRHEQPAALDAVDDRAADHAQQQARQRLRKTDQAEQKRRAGHRPDQPALRHGLDEIADVREAGAKKEQTKVAVMKRVERMRQMDRPSSKEGHYSTVTLLARLRG